MKKKTILIMALIVFFSLALILILIAENPYKSNQYSCNLDSDCVSQCANGCVNSEWADLNPDTSECFRAWDCSCENKVCYTDGQPRD